MEGESEDVKRDILLVCIPGFMSALSRERSKHVTAGLSDDPYLALSSPGMPM